MKRKQKKHVVSASEIKNDPSLRWHAYQWGELLVSDKLPQQVRFLRYEGDKIRVADYALRELPDVLELLEVRRQVFEPYKERDGTDNLKQQMALMNAMKKIGQTKRGSSLP